MFKTSMIKTIKFMHFKMNKESVFSKTLNLQMIKIIYNKN